MIQGLRQNLIFCLAATLLFVASVFSAAAMAPEREDAVRAEILHMGFRADDLCADGHGAHDHACPFCTLLPEADIPRLPDVALALVPYMLWRRADDLYRASQARDYARSPRAPPVLI
ncbi:hypothetical protein [Phaeobacter sp. HF9A]|uniref:hypothetical protein n=1 Tax=Phaeobacter sp. HF9A TaxID=2721561 RepID=UPI0014309462|nr:hypothetical protein [Phaeobacter sp. HF9A]NIZ12989.1 hypothetical protein [Phaeobacter sp. HF9A]